jgi:acyl-CoA synthetase (AMP-forming)/AMP-acid ligase II
MHIRHFLEKAASRYPDHECVVFGDTRLTTRRLLERAYRVSNALLGLGLKKGERVAVLLNNCHQSVECFFGIQSAGMVLVPLNARNSAQEHLYMINHSGARALMVGGEFTETVSSILPDAPSIAHCICVTGDTPKGMLDYEEILSRASPDEPDVEIADHDLITLRYTAGTTGRPKGVIHDHRAHTTKVHNMLMDGFPIEEGDSIILVGPITHASGSMILPHILRGARVIIKSGFDPVELLQTVERERATTLYLVPTMLVMMLSLPDLSRYNLGSIKTIRYGASPIAPDVLRRAMEVFGNVFVQGYGLTEGMMPITILGKEDHFLDGSERALRRLSSVGREVTVARVRIMDDEGNLLPPGETGEIVVQSRQVMRGYWRDPEATAEALRGGWLHTRDMGYMDEDGYIYLVDRKDDMIISGGFNIYPREVEDVLYRHPAVLEAAVFGVPDDLWGEAVRAAVSLKEGMRVTEEELIEHCRRHLASYKKPRSIEFREELPKSPYGKILRRKLREPYWKGRDREIH